LIWLDRTSVSGLQSSPTRGVTPAAAIEGSQRHASNRRRSRTRVGSLTGRRRLRPSGTARLALTLRVSRPYIRRH
jgi:hypothetical protein